MRIEKRTAKKAKNGYTFRLKIDYFDEYGIKRTYSKSGFVTKKEARAHGIEIEHELQTKGTLKTKCDKTLADCFREKMELEKNHLARSSIIQQENVFKNHILPKPIANAPIASLNYTLIQRYFNGISDLNEGIVKVQKKIFSKAFKHALKCGYITENPMHDIDISYKKNEEETHVVSFDELETIIDYFLEMNGHFSKYSYCIITYLGYYLGLRISETLALEKSDFDFEKDIVYISKKLEMADLKKEEMFLTETMKTAASRTTLPLPAPLKTILQEWFAFNPYELVCCDRNGNFASASAYRQRCHIISKKIGFRFHSHCLRHTYITNVVQSGTDIKTASKLARHSDAQTTLNVYAHTNETAKKEAIDSVFGKHDTKNGPNLKMMN